MSESNIRFSAMLIVRFASVNGGASVLVDQMDTGESTVMSAPVKLSLRSGSNSITFSANQNSEFTVHVTFRAKTLTF